MHSIPEEFQLMGGRSAPPDTPCRPPWAIAETAFIQTCEHCGKCINACPENILTCGRGGYPVVDFSKGGCTFCGACSRACTHGGIGPVDKHPWSLKAFIATTCLTNTGTECNTCSEACPALAIHLRLQLTTTAVPLLDEMLCNGCGSCVSACPASAIHLYSPV
jgi:ferredoxin-type protein NapF